MSYFTDQSWSRLRHTTLDGYDGDQVVGGNLTAGDGSLPDIAPSSLRRRPSFK